MLACGPEAVIDLSFSSYIHPSIFELLALLATAHLLLTTCMNRFRFIALLQSQWLDVNCNRNIWRAFCIFRGNGRDSARAAARQLGAS